MLPTFIGIGAMKAGTTTLWWHVSQHPQVFTCTPKEPQFFSKNWDKGLDWYERLFEGGRDAVAVGEFSTTYSKFPMYPETVDRLAATIPDARLVYLVRDPVVRMRSQWLHYVAEGREDRPIERALLEEPEYRTRSSYGLQVSRYLERFDREQLLVVQAESLFARPTEVMARVFEFIGVEPLETVPERQSNRSSAKFELPHSLRLGVRRLAGSRAYRAVPPTVRKAVGKRLRGAPPPAVVPDEVRAQILDLLAEDQQMFHELVGERLLA